MDNFSVTFWGVRGSVPSPGADTLKYGGNTSCVEVRCGDKIIVIDTGTGAVGLGRKLKTDPLQAANIFFSHFHWDHIQGFPFFGPIFNPAWRLNLYGPAMAEESLERVLRGQMIPPNFPITVDALPSHINFRNVQPGSLVDLGDGCEVDVFILVHPSPCCGYRVRYKGLSMVYGADCEHGERGFHKEYLKHCKDADFVIFDAAYTDDEYEGRVPPSRKHWGHSTWQQGVKLASALNIKQLALFHYDYPRSDSEIDGILADAKSLCPRVIAAQEGLTVQLL